MLVYMCTLFVHKHILYLYINFESQKVYTLTNTEYERRIYPLDLQAWYCIYAHYLPMLFRYFYRHMHCVYLYSIMHDVCLAHFYFTLKPFVPCKVYWYSIQYIYIYRYIYSILMPVPIPSICPVALPPCRWQVRFCGQFSLEQHGHGSGVRCPVRVFGVKLL